MKLIIHGSELDTTSRDSRLIGLIVEAHAVQNAVLVQTGSLAQIAVRLGKYRGAPADMMRISYLPRILSRTSWRGGNRHRSSARPWWSRRYRPIGWSSDGNSGTYRANQQLGYSGAHFGPFIVGGRPCIKSITTAHHGSNATEASFFESGDAEVLRGVYQRAETKRTAGEMLAHRQSPGNSPKILPAPRKIHCK